MLSFDVHTTLLEIFFFEFLVNLCFQKISFFDQNNIVEIESTWRELTLLVSATIHH